MANLVPVNNNQLSKKINPNLFFGKKAKVGTTKIKSKGTTLRSEFVLIRKKVIKIDKLLNAFIKFQKKNQEGTRREKELGKRTDRETKLEKKKDKVGAISFPSLPVGGNFLESIKRFLFFTFLNIALPKLLELLPKLRELGKAIAPATKFLLDIAGGVGKGLLSGLVNFIDWGYKIRDNTEKTIKQIGGDKASKDFNEFNKRLNTFIDLSILAGLTALDVGLDAEKFRKKQLKDQQKPKPRKVGVTEGKGGQKPIGRPNVTTGKGGKAGSGTVTQGSGGKPLGKFSKFKSGPFAKFAGPIGKFLGAATPFLGAGIGAADAAARFSSGDKVGGALASASAALDAFAGVAALTGIGLPLAAIATPISIAIDVVLLLRDLVKVMFPAIPMFRNGGRIKLFAQGGRVGSSGRTIKAQRKTFGAKSFKQEVKPGKDIGGKQQILKLFPDPSSENRQQTISASPWWERWLGGKNQTTQTPGKPANPYKALKTTAEILGKIPGPFGKLMSAGASIPLGQKPDRDIGRGFGSFVGQITQDIIDNNVNLSFGNIIKSISGFAGGGDIRNQNIMKNNDIGYQVGQVVEKAIGSLISSKVNEAVTSIQKEIASIGKPTEGDGGGGGGGDAGNIIVSSDQPDFWLLSTGALFENSNPQGAADVAQVIYNRVSAPGDPWNVDGSIRKAILSPSQFTPVSGYGGVSAWSKINNKQSAINFVKSNGKTQAQLESVASALLDTTRQRSAKTFVGPRDSFRATTKENKEYDQIARDTEVNRHGHIFGFEPAGAQIAAFRQGKLKPAEINKTIVSGKVSSGQLPLTGDNGRIKPSQLIKVGTLSSSPDGGPYWYGNGAYLRKSDAGPAFLNAKQAAAKEGITMVINSAYRSLEHQKALQGKYAVVAAVGSSPHGEGIALDIQTGTRGWNWLKTNGPTYGWRWMAIPNDEVHFEYVGGVRITSPKQQPPGQVPTPTPQATGRPSTAEQLRGKIQTQTQKNWTPPKDSITFTIPGKGTYYADMKSNKVYDSRGMPVDVSGGKNRFILEGLQNKKQTNPELFRASASLAPSQNKQSVDSLAFNPSYSQEGQSGFLAIQPIRETLIQQA
jgi:hypothetical protein